MHKLYGCLQPILKHSSLVLNFWYTKKSYFFMNIHVLNGTKPHMDHKLYTDKIVKHESRSQLNINWANLSWEQVVMLWLRGRPAKDWFKEYNVWLYNVIMELFRIGTPLSTLRNYHIRLKINFDKIKLDPVFAIPQMNSLYTIAHCDYIHYQFWTGIKSANILLWFHVFILKLVGLFFFDKFVGFSMLECGG